MRVANAASLALMLQERAEPSLLFLRARIAMILQILRTERQQEIKGLFLHIALFVQAMARKGGEHATLLRHLSLLTDPQHLQRFPLRV